MRTLTSTRRSAVVSVLAFLLVVAGAQAAHACSCLIGDPRDALHRSDGAFVGTLVERTEVDQQTVDLHVRGRDRGEGHARRRGRRAFGLERRVVRVGGRVRTADRPAPGDVAEDGAWTSNLCSQIDPDVLLQAAQPLPAPDGVGPVRYVVGGNLGENRLMALDRKGRTLAYGPGDGYARDVDVCPGATRALEAVTLGRRAQLVVRELPSLDVVQDDHARRDATSLAPARGVPERQRRPVARRGTPQGRVLGASGDRDDRPCRVARPRPRRRDPGRTRLRDRRPRAVRGEPARRASRPLAPIPAHVQGITISPDGARIAGFVFGRFEGTDADAVAGRQHPHRGRPDEGVRGGRLRVRRGGVGERPTRSRTCPAAPTISTCGS